MRKSTWAFILSLTISAPAIAGEGVWTPMGGPEAPTARVLVDPIHPETVYAMVAQRAPEGSGALWKSTDGGETWESIQEGIGSPIDQLVLDPLRSGRLYAWRTLDEEVQSQSKLWVSEDGGETWAVRFDGSFKHFWQIIASPIQEGVLFAWTDSRTVDALIYRSTDGGATWKRRGEIGRTRSSIDALSFNRARKGLEFFDAEAFYVSGDDGLTWSVRGTYQGVGFESVARSDAAPDRLYAHPFLANVCLVRSDDGGATWRKLRAPAFPRSLSCSSISVDPRNPNLVRVVAEGQAGRQYLTLLATSRDGGATWSAPRPSPVSLVVPTMADPDTLFGNVFEGIRWLGLGKSTDGGESWKPSWDGIASGDVRGSLIAFPGAERTPTLLATFDGLLLRSVDGGGSWTTVAIRTAAGLERDAGGEILYALRYPDSRLVKSSDRGETWVLVPKPHASLSGLIADPYRSGRVFATVYDYGDSASRVLIWRIVDAAEPLVSSSTTGLPVECVHAASTDFCPGPMALTSDPRDPERVLLAFRGVDFTGVLAPVYVSRDGGARWHLAAQSPPGGVFALAADPGVPGAFLAGTFGGGIYRSADGGEHWTAFGSGVPSPVSQLLHDDRSGTWYAVTTGRGVFRSTDGGRSWNPTGPGLPDRTFPQAVLDPQVPDRLFLAVRGQGVWSWSAPARN
jgi:photosystem II stability/assembly factor-like uncharacterized protein